MSSPCEPILTGDKTGRRFAAYSRQFLLQLPNEKAEKPRDARDDGRSGKAGHDLLHSDRNEHAGEMRNQRQQELVRHRDDRKMFDRVDLRLDQTFTANRNT